MDRAPILALLLALVPACAHAGEYAVEMPFGSHNPELNTPAEVWYDPPSLAVAAGDTVTWYNADREAHTVSSGQGSGRYGWMGDDFGTPTGLFESGAVRPGGSWSRTFDEPGVFAYFCTIHPWMEGSVTVGEGVPGYPHDAAGRGVEFPLLAYTPDGGIEVNLSWDPPVLMTHERAQFVYQFYDPYTNSNLANMKYSIAIIQGGRELFRDEGLNQIGGDYRNFVFEEPGGIIIRVEGIEAASVLAEAGVTVPGSPESAAHRSVDFTAYVHGNPGATGHAAYEAAPAQRLQTYYELMLVIILVPAAMFIAALLWVRAGPRHPGARYGAV